MCITKSYKSPINYTGNKYRLLEQFKKYFPTQSYKTVDLFTGGSTVAINMNSESIVAIDNNLYVINLLNFLKNQDYNNLIKKIEKVIKQYNLSNSYKYSYSYYKNFVIKNTGLKSYNLNGYNSLRRDYNLIKNKNSDKANLYLYLLVMYGFNNDIRFNSKNEFNLPVGKTDMNKNNREKLENYIKACNQKNIEFINKDFRDLDMDFFKDVDFVYVDPPYLITDAVYNESNKWNVDSEKALLNLLDKLDSMNIKFALSNVLQKDNNNVKNNVLLDWLSLHKEYNVYNIEYHYRSSSYNKINRNAKEQEVLITNYEQEEN